MPNESAAVRLLLWNEHDVHTRLGMVLVAEPETTPAADLGALLTWLEARCAEGEEPEAIYMTSIAAGQELAERARITEIRTLGFGVFLKPSSNGSTPDLGAAAVSQIETAKGRGQRIAEVLVATHDAGLRSQLEGLVGDGTVITVLGFREEAGFAAESTQLGFLDVEDTGAFGDPLPRTNLFDLPEDGLSLPPLKNLAPRKVSVAVPAAEPVAEERAAEEPVAVEAAAADVASPDEPGSLESASEPAADEPTPTESVESDVAAVNAEAGATEAFAGVGTSFSPPAPPEIPHTSVGLYPSRPAGDGGALAGSATSPWSLDPNRPGRVSPPNGSGE